MKNRILLLAIILCLVASLFGCSNTPDPSGPSVPTDDSSAVPAPEKDPYDRLLREYYSNMRIGNLNYSDEGYGAIRGYIEANGTQTILTDIGYAFRDINSDGAKELIIAPVQREGETKGLVYSVFTLKNNKPQFVLGTVYRSSYYLTDSGFFYNDSVGAAYHVFAEYTLSKQGVLECKDYYYTKEINEDMSNIGCFHNKTGNFNGDTNDLMNISLDEFWELEKEVGKNRVNIELVPFADYKY